MFFDVLPEGVARRVKEMHLKHRNPPSFLNGMSANGRKHSKQAAETLHFEKNSLGSTARLVGGLRKPAVRQCV